MSYPDAITNLENALWDMFNHVLKHERIFFERTNYIKPDEDFVTLRIASMKPLEREGSFVGDGPDGKPTTYLNYEVLVDIRAYRGFAVATAGLLRHAFSMGELRRRYLYDNEIGYLHSSTIDDSTVVIDGERWESRGAFYSLFHIQISLEDIYGTDGAIETVLTNETVEAPEKTILMNDTITLNP